ncbi:MAG: GNAT family N-acetyltransferase [Vicinamibacteraceae bacterium]
MTERRTDEDRADTVLRTPRLILRRWRPSDRAPFAALNADPEVMAHFPSALTAAESDALAEAIEAHHAARGYGLWALDIPGVVPFAGFVGLSVPAFDAPFTPCVEIGWRLAAPQWDRGYATEAARAVLAHAWGVLGVDEVVSFTTAGNDRSRAVMTRIGMRHDPGEDFDHPRLPAGHPLRPHVLYRTARPSVRRV